MDATNIKETLTRGNIRNPISTENLPTTPTTY